MRTSVVAALMAFASSVVGAAEGPVMFHVTVKSDGRIVESPSFLATVGQPATVRLSSGIAVEALAKPLEADGGAWTQVRITYFETPTSRFVQEMSSYSQYGLRTGSFEYTDPTNRRYLIKVGGQRQ
jgi:hypothetical protein